MDYVTRQRQREGKNIASDMLPATRRLFIASLAGLQSKEFLPPKDFGPDLGPFLFRPRQRNRPRVNEIKHEVARASTHYRAAI